ncbi:hypothetical protein ACSSVY_004375, partial [Roseovarius sp. MBR-51]
VSHTLNRFQKCDTGKILKTNGTQSQKLRQADIEGLGGVGWPEFMRFKHFPEKRVGVHEILYRYL